jgi:hypothetical protein
MFCKEVVLERNLNSITLKIECILKKEKVMAETCCGSRRYLNT